jgi:hygromycin-B 4-O-kinase
MERPAVDESAARTFLAERFGGVTDVLVAPRQGAWSQTYFFRDGRRELVIRFGEQAWNFEKDRGIARFATSDLPIPQVLEVGQALGCWYAVSERAFGTILEDVAEAPLRRALPSLLRALDAMRAVDLSDSTGFGPWAVGYDGELPTWRAYLERLPSDPYSSEPHQWRANLARRPAQLRELDDVHAVLLTLVDPCPEVRHLIHSDLLYGNVLLDEERGRVSAVFDWGCALAGDFLYDLAWLTFWAPWHEGLGAIDLRAEALAHYASIGLDVPDFAARLGCYELHIGLGGLAYQAFIEDWDGFDATARRVRELVGRGTERGHEGAGR